jgi:hypothetical protein
MAVNKNFDREIPLDVEILHSSGIAKVTAWTLSGTSIDANTGTELFQAPGVRWAKQAGDERNPRIDRGGPDEVKITSKLVSASGPRWMLPLPPASITAVEVDLR